MRFLLKDGPGPCRIVFGPVAPDIFFQFQEVGEIATPDGPTFVMRAFVVGDSEGPDLDVDGVGVHLSSTADTVDAFWSVPPSMIGLSTRSLDESQVRKVLPSLVRTSDTPELAQELVERIDGAQLHYAGPAPGYDVGLSYDDGTLSIAGRGVADAQLDVLYAILDGERTDSGKKWRTDVLGATESRAQDATVIIGSRRDREEVSSTAFADVVEDRMGGAEPTIAISEGFSTSAGFSCQSPHDPFAGIDATITDISIAESDVGALLRISFDGLPADRAEPGWSTSPSATSSSSRSTKATKLCSSPRP